MQDEAFGTIPVLIQNNEIHFLLLQHQARHWGFPKGHAEPGESALAAAYRELEEETGIQQYERLGSQEFVEQYQFVKSGDVIKKTVLYFPVQVKSATVVCQAEEIKDFVWLPYEQALDRITFASAQQILRQVQSHLVSLGMATPPLVDREDGSVDR